MDKTNSALEDFVLLVHHPVMDVLLLLLTVSNALMVLLNQDQFVKKVA